MSMDAESTRRAIADRMTAIRAYQGSELFEHFKGLLESLAESHMQDLADISMDRLELKQGALRQLRSLIRSMGNAEVDPKV